MDQYSEEQKEPLITPIKVNQTSNEPPAAPKKVKRQATPKQLASLKKAREARAAKKLKEKQEREMNPVQEVVKDVPPKPQMVADDFGSTETKVQSQSVQTEHTVNQEVHVEADPTLGGSSSDQGAAGGSEVGAGAAAESESEGGAPLLERGEGHLDEALFSSRMVGAFREAISPLHNRVALLSQHLQGLGKILSGTGQLALGQSVAAVSTPEENPAAVNLTDRREKRAKRRKVMIEGFDRVL